MMDLAHLLLGSNMATPSRRYRRPIAKTSRAGGAVTLYTFTTYMQKFLVNTAGVDVNVVSVVMTVAIVFAGW